MTYHHTTYKTKRIKSIKQGVEFWHVHSFPKRGLQGPIAYLDRYVALGKAYESSGSLWIPVYKPVSWNLYRTPALKNFVTGKSGLLIHPYSCMDAHLTPQTYNCHRTFFSKKAAERYVKLVESGCNIQSMFPNYNHYKEQP